MSETIKEYLDSYEFVSNGCKIGAMNCIIRTYFKESCKNRYILSAEDFFKCIDEKTDNELLNIRNMGKGKLAFLREASKFWNFEKHAGNSKKEQYKTRFNWIGDDWKRVKNHCRTTDNKEFTENEPTEEFKRKLLISEHSPIRLLEIDWTWEGIKSWVSVHWTRHKHEKFVSTQRDDRKKHELSRDDMPQGTPVNMDNYANMQNLIDIFRKRLCYQASPETREYAEDFKLAFHEIHPEMADVLVPNCVYRCGCPEFKTCGYWKKFIEYVESVTCAEITGLEDTLKILTNVQSRYDMYNMKFYEDYGIIKEEE